MLYWISTIINFVFLIAAVWLGIYIVSRSPRNPVSWLTGLTLLSVASMFLNMLLAFNPPPIPQELPSWVPLLFPFWPAGTTASGWSGWLQGWLVIPAIVFWHHVTVLLRPGKMTPWRWTRIIFGYALALAAVFIHLNTDLLFSSVSGDPLYLNTLKPGPLYPAILALLLLFTVMSLVNLQRSARSTNVFMQKKQLNNLSIATLIAGLTVPVALIAALFAIPIPRITITIILGTAVILLGLGVARYSALMEGRTIRRDFIFNALAMGVITGIYLLATWISSQIFVVPFEAYILVVLLAILTHTLMDVSGQSLAKVIYGKNRQLLRSDLNVLSRSIGEQDLSENLANILDTMCNSVRATYSLIILFEEYSLRQIAACQIRRGNLPVSIGDLTADDVQHLEPDHFPSPLDTAALLIPLYSNSDQIGAIIFGRPINGIHYLPSDVDLLLYPSDKVADVIQRTQREEKYIFQLSQLAQAQESGSAVSSGVISTPDVEDAMRNLFDFAHLGDTPLVELKLVQRHLPTSDVTHIDQGKAVHTVLSETVEKLRPAEDQPGEPLPREWYPYRILHGAYIEDMPNRDIMAQLYISEGTFNRTRRAAIRSVTRMLQEMEAASN
jgi:hypothetical protein